MKKKAAPFAKGAKQGKGAEKSKSGKAKDISKGAGKKK